jgi:hypothetical protein
MPDLLPDDFGTEQLIPPVAILREQTEHLTRRTGGLIHAIVSTAKRGKRIIHQFDLIVPNLDDYVYNLFTVSHEIFFYPVDLVAEVVPLVVREIPTAESLQDELRKVFAHQNVKKTVAALKAQAEAVST